MLNEIVLHGAEKRPITPSPHGVENQTPNIKKKKTPASGSLTFWGVIGRPINEGEFGLLRYLKPSGGAAGQCKVCRWTVATSASNHLQQQNP